jgi:Zn-dependent M28 family amino/carboxypeptidase
MQRRVTEVLFIDSATMKTILEAAAPGPDDKQEILDDDDEAIATMTDLSRLAARLVVELESDKPTAAPACNVIGILRGSDPKLKEEYVAVGCHLDHLGVRTGVIHPGADDDGSGSAALMAISQAFAQNQVRPKRSIVFMAFCGEEKGLISSAFFASRCKKEGKPILLSQIVGELQVDMIGRNETRAREMGPREDAADNVNTLHLIGTKKLSSDLHDLCMRANERAGFELEWDSEGVFFRSDHWSFAKYGVPIAFFFTGFHGQYHQPKDTVEKIDFPKLARVAAYVYDIGFELAQAEKRPMVDAARWRRLRSRQRRGRLPKDPAAPMRPEKKEKPKKKI